MQGPRFLYCATTNSNLSHNFSGCTPFIDFQRPLAGTGDSTSSKRAVSHCFVIYSHTHAEAAMQNSTSYGKPSAFMWLMYLAFSCGELCTSTYVLWVGLKTLTSIVLVVLRFLCFALWTVTFGKSINDLVSSFLQRFDLTCRPCSLLGVSHRCFAMNTASEQVYRIIIIWR